MCEENGKHSRSHGIKSSLIREQADCLGLELIQQQTSSREYEKNFKSVVSQLKRSEVTKGIFGDIYLQEHRDWIERVCDEMNIDPVFPLWHNDTIDLLKEFIQEGFKALTVSVRSDMLGKEWLGRNLDGVFLDDILALGNIDACAENGEYHTFVYDGPTFSTPVEFKNGEVSKRDKLFFLELL